MDNAEPVRSEVGSRIFGPDLSTDSARTEDVTQATPDRLQNVILTLYEKSVMAFEVQHLRMVTEQGLYGIGLISIDTFRVIYPPLVYRTLDIEECTYWHFINEL